MIKTEERPGRQQEKQHIPKGEPTQVTRENIGRESQKEVGQYRLRAERKESSILIIVYGGFILPTNSQTQ